MKSNQRRTVCSTTESFNLPSWLASLQRFFDHDLLELELGVESQERPQIILAGSRVQATYIVSPFVEGGYAISYMLFLT